MADDNIKNLEREAALLRVKADLLGDISEAEQQSLDRQAELAEALKEQRELAEKIVAAGKDADDEDKKKFKRLQDRLDIIKTEIEIEAKRNDQVKQAVAQAKELNSITANYISQLTTIDTTYKKTLLGNLMLSVGNANELIEAFKKSDKTVKDLGKSILSGIGSGLKTIAGTFLGTFEQTFVTVLKDSIAFRGEMVKATGRVEDFGSQAQAMKSQMDGLTIGLSHTRETLMALNLGFGNFRNISGETRTELEKTTTLLVALGVSSDTAVGFMDGLVKTFGFTGKEATKIAKQFKGLSDTVKFTTEEMMSGFEAAQASLGVFGKDSVRIFGNIAKMADRTGVAISSLQGLADNFNTFSSGAQMVGDLNTALEGNYFNLEQMMELDPDQQIQKIKEVVQARFGDIDSLNKHQKRMIASAMGMNNTAEAMALLRDETKESTFILDQYGISQEKAEEATAAAAGPMAKLQFAFEEMIPKITPIIEKIMELVETVTNLISGNEELIFGVIAVGTAFTAVGKVVGPIFGLFKTFGLGSAARAAGTKAEAVATVGLSNATRTMGASAMSASVGMGKLSAASAGFLIPLAVIIASLTALFALLLSFATDAGPETVATLGLLVLEMGALALTTAAVSAAAATLTLTGLGALLGLGAMAIGLGLVALALKFISTSDLEALATIMESVSTISNPFGAWSTGLATFANAAETASGKISMFLLPLMQLLFALKTSDPASVVQVVKSVSEIDKDNVEGLEAAKAMLHQITVTANNAQVDSLNALAATVNSLQKAKMAPIKVEVKLNGRVFDDAVAKVVDNKG